MSDKREEQYVRALTILNSFINQHGSFKEAIGELKWGNKVLYFGDDTLTYLEGHFEIHLKDVNQYYLGHADDIGFFNGRYFCIFENDNPEQVINFAQLWEDHDFSGRLKVIVPEE